MEFNAKIGFVGDVILKTRGKKNPFSYFIHEFNELDLLIVNLETIISNKAFIPSKRKSVLFKTEEKNLVWLEEFKDKVLFCLSNNHIYDYFEEGYNDTIACLNRKGFMFCEYNNSKVIYLKGKKLNVNNFNLTGDWQKEYKKVNLNYVIDAINIVAVHWGKEHLILPAPYQIKLAEDWLSRGFKIIVGHHSHTLNPIERIDNDKIIAYSLGNFNSFQFDIKPSFLNLYSGLLTVLIKGDSLSYHMMPCYIDDNYSPKPTVLNFIDTINNEYLKYKRKPFWKQDVIFKFHTAPEFFRNNIVGGFFPRIRKNGWKEVFPFIKWFFTRGFLYMCLIPFSTMFSSTKTLRRLKKYKLNEKEEISN
ncbi:CapA family protein [Maribellus luteus]|uniref:CapA family protein n=1 Tax=Maribellus luteus TaxID=2305463 RepID=A0A399T4L6_9BACT|nr:CapA family protein [Maribellus luteus]RIJ49712.1 CapA family protein [Maribellus luteus]